MSSSQKFYLVALVSAAIALVGFRGQQGTTAGAAASQGPACDPENAGLKLPDGFCAVVFADDLGSARHMAVAPNGDVFVALRQSRREGSTVGIMALRDADGDGVADVKEHFGDKGGTGIALSGGYLYFGHNAGVVRYPLPAGSLEPAGPEETVVSDLPDDRSHRDKSLVLAEDGSLYVNIGAPSNTCQEEDRTSGSPGQDPCPELERRAGVWKFDANETGQTQENGERYATGLRNMIALALHPESGALFGAMHGRDQLGQNWSDHFTLEDNAEKPSEEFMKIEAGDDFGWPYCFHDPDLDRLVLSPEYGGDGQETGRCSEKKEPLAAFPAHWGPNALLFYTGAQFPERYRGGAFIAFHGSWNRAPLPQGGYNVVFLPLSGEMPSGDWEVFADGFAGEDVSPRGAEHRPSGLAQAPDGSIYVSDDRGGRIYRIYYPGS